LNTYENRRLPRILGPLFWLVVSIYYLVVRPRVGILSTILIFWIKQEERVLLNKERKNARIDRIRRVVLNQERKDVRIDRIRRVVLNQERKMLGLTGYYAISLYTKY